MSNLSLYEIAGSFPALMENEEISEQDKEIIKEELVGLLQQKSQNIIGYIRNEKAIIEAMKTEKKRFSDQIASRENKLDRFETYVKDCMENYDIKKIDTGLGTLTIAKSPISVEIINENEIPDEYKTEVTTIKIDKKKIADNFKETGEMIDGVVIHTNNTNLRIK